MTFLYLPFRHTVFLEGKASTTYGIRCWQLSGHAPKLCGQVDDISPDEAFVKRLALCCTRHGLEPCHLVCVVEDALAGGLPA